MKRIESLDFLRGIAIVLVLLRHFPDDISFVGGVSFQVISHLKSLGYIGVDLFFVLSGFLVSGLFFQKMAKGEKPLIKRFLVRRAFKIWPSYYIYLLFIFSYGIYSNGFSATWDSYFSAIFHLQNYILTNKLHLWSLSLEEHFYTFLGCVIFLIHLLPGKRAKKNSLISIILLISLPVFTRYLLPDHHTYMTHIRADGLFVGVLVGLIFHLYNDFFTLLKKFQGPLFITACIFLVPTLYYVDLAYRGGFVRVFGFLSLYISFALFLICALNSSENTVEKLFNSTIGKLLQKFGFLSYGIYLWHLDLGGYSMYIYKKILGKSVMESAVMGSIFIIIYLILMYLGGAISMKLIEKPFLKLRDRYYP